MLAFSDIDNVDRGEFAVAGTSGARTDASNDPAHAESWPASRNIRAELIRWLCVDHQAASQVDPKGIRVIGARIIDVLDLALVNVPIPIVLDNCEFKSPIVLNGAELPYLELDGSYVREIHASGIVVHNNLSMAKNFHAIGPISLDHAKIGLDLDFGGASLRYEEDRDQPFLGRHRDTLFAYLLQVGGNVWLNRRFESYGSVNFGGAKIGGNLHFDSGHFINPNNAAISAPGASIDGVVFLRNFGTDGDVEVTGLANFSSDRVGDSFIVDHARFLGAPGGVHGFNGSEMSVARTFIWRNVTLQNGAQCDLRDASVGLFLDDWDSWPEPGKLLIDGLAYNGLSAAVYDADDGHAHDASAGINSVDSRLKWLALQPPGFHSQPYNQLGKYYLSAGEEASAIKVFIAEEDDRYSRLGFFGRMLGGFLKATIGYGHRPLLAFNWSVLVIIVGWIAVLAGKRAGVMRLTWPENTPPPEGDPLAGLHPLLYSLDIFLPFVNLHQEPYWWPDENSAGHCEIAGRQVSVRGSLLRTYLWLQIIAGWLLSAIFIAGVTGLIHNY